MDSEEWEHGTVSLNDQHQRTDITAVKKYKKDRSSAGILLYVETEGTKTVLEPDIPNNPAGTWHEIETRENQTKPRERAGETSTNCQLTYTFRVDTKTQAGASRKYQLNQTHWDNISKTLGDSVIYVGNRKHQAQIGVPTSSTPGEDDRAKTTYAPPEKNYLNKAEQVKQSRKKMNRPGRNPNRAPNNKRQPSTSADLYGILQPTKTPEGNFTWQDIAITPWGENGQFKLVVAAK